MMLSSIKKICSFFKERKRARNIFIVFVTLSNLNKTSHRTRAAVQLFKEHDWESVFVKLHFCIDPMTILVSHQAAPPHILQQNCAHARVYHRLLWSPHDFYSSSKVQVGL